ncbi:MAG: hypothetical protein IKW64_06165 [Clostridia bacterium]|nr:hypothetical protein [Clostridia bacterium]
MEQFEDISLKRLAEILLKRIGLIVAATLIAGVLAFVYSEMMIVPEYESAVSLYVNNEIESNVNKTLGSDIQASQMLVDTYIVIIKSDTVLNQVSQKLIEKGVVGYDAEMLRGSIAASAVNATEIFEIKVRDTNPMNTYTIANTIADVAPPIIQDFVEASSVKVVDYAVEGERVSPNIQSNMIIGLLIGLFLSCLFVVLKEIFDMRIKDEDELEQWFKLPILGVIPDITNTQTRRQGYYSYRRGGKAYEYEKKGVQSDAGKSNKNELVSKAKTNSK